MTETLVSIFTVVALMLGGFGYVKYKNHQIAKYREQNNELARDKAIAEMEAMKESQKAEASEAARTFQDKAYRAVLNKKKAEKGSDTPLSEEDRKIAKEIMDNHTDRN